MRDHMNFSFKVSRALRHTMIACAFSLLGSIAAVAQTPANSSEAGKVLMAIGDVKVTRNGQTTVLAKGASVQAGDSIITGVASNAQLRMSDGAVIALRAQTDFKINEYKFNGKSDGSEKATLSLVKGGVRAVTGAIGKGENKDNLQVNAVVATVGIRGTGFNISYCDGNCFNKDKTPAKDGLYAGVFEGQILVKNQAATDTVGVDEYLYVADKDSRPKRLSEPPNFLPDPLAGQKSAKPKDKTQGGDIPSLNTPVDPPAEPADSVVAMPSSPLIMMMGVVVSPSPYLASGVPPFYPTTLYNLAGQGDGVTLPQNLACAPYCFYLQKAETWPAASGGQISTVDNLPPHNVSVDSNPITASPITGLMAVNYAGSGVSSYATQIGLQSPPYYVANSNPRVPVTYSIGTATQAEGGNLLGVLSWGRWANGNIIVADYNGGVPFNMPAGNGFHYIVGDRTDPSQLAQMLQTGPTTLNFSLVGATTPTAVGSSMGSWIVTSGNMTANFASAQLSGNLGLYNNQSAGYGFYNMAYSGSLSASAPSTNVNANVTQTSGNSNVCAGGCAGTGNVVFYGNPTTGTVPAKAAGLSYNFTTSNNNVMQGVAVFKR